MGTHAFFKALLFIGAGNSIHASERYQDRRVTGGLAREIMPLTTRTILLSSIRLCGLPFIAAFYSKEIIIEIILLIIPAVTGGRFVITIFEEKTFLIVSFHLKLIRLGLIIAGVLTFGVFSFYGMYFSRTVRV